MNEENEMPEYKCSECGADVTAEDKVCPNCGANLEELVEIPDPDEMVMLKTYPNEIEAQYAARYLNAHGIKASLGIKLLTQTVMVRRSDVAMAEEILSTMKPMPAVMRLGDIFNNAINLVGKTFTRNIIIACVFYIPAGLILAYSMQGFFSSIYDASGNDITKVQVEEVERRDITETIEVTGKIDTELKAVVEVDEFDLIRLNTGDTAWVSINKPEYKNYKGIVSEIDTKGAEADTGRTYMVYKAKITLFDSDNNLQYGMDCDASIDTETREDVITVPGQSVTTRKDSSEGAEEKDVVFIVDDDKAKLVEVETGISDYDYTEIISGLGGYEKAISGDYDAIRELSDGDKIEVTEDYDNGGLDDENTGNSMRVFTGMVLYFLSFLIFFLCYVAAETGIIRIASSTAEGERISVQEAFKRIFSLTYLRGIGLFVIMGLSIAAIICIPLTLLIISGIAKLGVLAFLAGVGLFGAFLLMVFFLVRWAFAFVHLVYTDEGIVASLKKSFWLVKGYWWRTLGIIMLVSLVINFAVTLVSTPISFLFMWDYYSQYFSMASNEGMGDNPKASLEMMKSLGFAFGLITILTTILQSLISPMFYVTVYRDLKVRKLDFPVEVPEEENTNNGEKSIE